MVETAHVFNDVVCGLLVRSGRVLFVHRNASRLWAPNCWDAPGGHIEQGESDIEALGREMNEELGISFSAGSARLAGRLTGSDYDARVFVIDSWSGAPVNRAPHEHDDLVWFGEEQLSGLVLADPDLLEIVLAVLRDR
ncbi:MAG: NUDIX domain-containing protein [Acidimicrobiales bacterium]|jgi:8-oxo-dGTP diphosphatase